MIKYIPCDHATVLFLHHERLRPKNVNLDPERYTQLKESAMERMQKMIDYISEEDTCRSSYLLEYFGQTESSDCGTCDICRSARKSPAQKIKAESEDTAAEITSFINVEKSGKYTVEDINRRFGPPDSKMSTGPDGSPLYISILRRLIDLGTVPPPQN